MKNNRGFILITVLIFIILFSLIIQQSWQNVFIEKKLFTTLQLRIYLFNLAQSGITNAVNNNLICNKELCVKSYIQEDKKIIISTAKKNTMSIIIKAVYKNYQLISWEQILD